jgi:leucyl aminopeptidase
MQISFVQAGSIGAGSHVVGVLEGGALAPSAIKANEATGGALERAVKAARFKGQAGKLLDVVAPAGVEASRIVLAGIGKGETFDSGAAERLAAAVIGKLLASGDETITFAVDVPKKSKLSEGELAAHLALGATLRSYRFDHYRKVAEDEKPTVNKVAVQTRARPAASKVWAQLSPVAEGVFLARDLVNEPANILYPEEFAKRTLALRKLGVKVEIFDVPQMKKLGMNALLGVGQGSAHDSRMAVMQWNGAPRKKAKNGPLVFVGKGVCFDSGGLSLKPANSMMGMKGDMAGAAAVVGLMHALAKRNAKVNAVGLIGLVENMPDGKAQRPNDIVKTMSGQTIEVLNTDAEGRLVLADVLWYAQSRFHPRVMINLATLTGAILIALGSEYAGLFSNNDELANRLAQVGYKEGESVWRLPLAEGYDRLVKSKIADMKNIGGPSAGSITAAQILQRFVNNVPWAHLDIAGVAWQDSEQRPLIPSWGTGWGVRILNRFSEDYYEK